MKTAMPTDDLLDDAPRETAIPQSGTRPAGWPAKVAGRAIANGFTSADELVRFIGARRNLPDVEAGEIREAFDDMIGKQVRETAA